MGKEYEIQVLEVDVASMRQKLKKLKGKRIHKSIKFVRSVFNRCNSKIRSFVRVRNEGKKTTMTIKIYNDPKFPDEHEVTIEEDFETGKNFLEALNLKMKAYQETYREKWSLPIKGVHEITFDIWPGLPQYMEIDCSNKKTLDKVESILKVKNPRLITVSRFDKRKNHEKIVMALKNLKQIYPDIVYICVGYGEEEENIKKLVKELDLEAQVMFFKDISNDLKNALVSKSNIFVMPSIIHKKSVEGFGIAYVEAAQYGIPSIGGKDGGAADAIDHEKTGLICDGNNLDDIYSSINSMLENKKYLELGKNAKEFVNKFQWSKIIEEYKKILN